MPKKYKFKFNWVVNGKLAIGTCPRYEEDLIKIKENNGILTKFGTNLLNFWLNIVFIKLLHYKSLRNSH